MNGVVGASAERRSILWSGEKAVNVTGVRARGDDAEACDLSLVVDTESGEQVHGRVCWDERVEIVHVALVPYECSWVAACRSGRCDGGADDIAPVVYAEPRADIIAVQYSEVYHGGHSSPQERMKDLVAGQSRRSCHLSLIVD